MSKNNPIEKAREAKFKSEITQFKEELLMTHANNLADNNKYKSEKEDSNVVGSGASYNDLTEDFSITTRTYSPIDRSGPNVGFRVRLYIKTN